MGPILSPVIDPFNMQIGKLHQFSPTMKQEVELQTIPTADEKTFTAKLPIRIHIKK